MKYTRLYTDKLGESHFEDIDIPLTDRGDVGFLSADVAVATLQFRENKADYAWDFHVAPSQQFIVLLDGVIEIETSLGDVRQFNPGDILLVEDVTGKGHRTKNITQNIRRSLFIKL